MKRDDNGYIVIPDDTDCTEVNFSGTNRVKLGNGCELGDRCELGEFIDIRATFEGGRVKNGLYVQAGNIGSEHRTAYFFIDENGALFVRAGCWFSSMAEFRERVRSVHGGTMHEAEYLAACEYAEKVLPVKLANWEED